MKDPIECENMADIRSAIDEIDREIVSQIALRSKYVSTAAKFKKNEQEVKDVGRVEKVIESKKALAEEYGISPILISNIYEMMIDFFVKEEMVEWKEGK